MQQDVKDYYGKTLGNSNDLQTNACCTTDAPAPHLRKILSKVHDEVLARYYGCGLIALMSWKVAIFSTWAVVPAGIATYWVPWWEKPARVTGVDMTEEQLAVANQHIEYHREVFGHAKANVRFCMVIWKSSTSWSWNTTGLILLSQTVC